MFHTRNDTSLMLTFLYKELVKWTHLDVAVSEKYNLWFSRYIQTTLLHFPTLCCNWVCIQVTESIQSQVSGRKLHQLHAWDMKFSHIWFSMLFPFYNLMSMSMGNLEAMFWRYCNHRIEGSWFFVNHLYQQFSTVVDFVP